MENIKFKKQFTPPPQERGRNLSPALSLFPPPHTPPQAKLRMGSTFWDWGVLALNWDILFTPDALPAIACKMYQIRDILNIGPVATGIKWTYWIF